MESNQEQRNNQKGQRTIPILLTILGIGVVLFVAGNAMKGKNTNQAVNDNVNIVANQNTNISVPTNTNSEVLPPEPEPIVVTETKIDTSGWKTYKDPVTSFTIRYPEEWRLRSSYELEERAFESGGRPEFIWSGPSFLPNKLKKDGWGADIHILDMGTEIDQLGQTPEGYARESLYYMNRNGKDAGLRIYQINNLTVKVLGDKDELSCDGKDIVTNLRADVEYKDLNGQQKSFSLYYNPIYSDMYDGEELLKAILLTFKPLPQTP